MKNLKTRTKLLASFIALAVLTTAVGVVGIVSISTLEQKDTAMYEIYVQRTSDIGDLREAYQKVRANLRRMAITCEFVPTEYQESLQNGQTYIASVQGMLDKYAEGATDKTKEANFWNLKQAFEGPYMDAYNGIAGVAASTHSTDATYKQILTSADVATNVENYLAATEHDNVTWADELSVENTATARTVSIVQIIAIAIAVGAALFMAFYISSLISKPLAFLTSLIKRISDTGDLKIPPDMMKEGDAYGARKDEIGVCMNTFGVFLRQVIHYAEALETVAARDLTVDVGKISENDTIGSALERVVGELNGMFSEIRTASDQVTTGASQIADGAQNLAAGSTQQAATVQQLSTSINEVSDKTDENASKANHAAELSSSIRDSAERGAERMGHMLDAVKEINEASTEISKVIKSIDDIAFQTNILALNAAVEAARAGEHGKGFAVVADEVRNLAAKSAEAAKDTGALIENSIAKASIGAKIADETSSSFTEIVNGVSESAEIIGQIAEASEEQSASIKQITVGMGQIAEVVQNNSATAEQSAAASEQMSSQSALLNELVSRFKINVAGYSLTGGMDMLPRY